MPSDGGGGSPESPVSSACFCSRYRRLRSVTPRSLRGVRAHAAGALERLEEQAALDLAQHVVEVAPVLGQLDEGGGGLRAAAPRDLARQVAEADVGPVASATARSMMFSSSRTLPGKA